MKPIYAHDDDSKWGVHFALACGRAGVRCTLFRRPDEVPDGAVAFVRLNQMGSYREQGKRIVEVLSKRGIATLPNAFEAQLYDDKAAQISVLKAWLPPTHLIQDANEALELAQKMSYPFMSKSLDGASSAGVRLIHSVEKAQQEVRKVFSLGIPSVYNRKQKGYLIWQDFIPENDCDYRVIITSDRLFGLKRYVREDRPMASGSGNNEPILTLDEPKARKAFQTAIEISQAIQTQWMAYDFVFDGDKPYVLEMSSAWTAGPYHFAQMFDFDLKPTNERGGHMFDKAVEICRNI
jgi:glutathione synthase/RimK-type ligase-like ATP-grasp enzyme